MYEIKSKRKWKKKKNRNKWTRFLFIFFSFSRPSSPHHHQYNFFSIHCWTVFFREFNLLFRLQFTQICPYLWEWIFLPFDMDTKVSKVRNWIKTILDKVNYLSNSFNGCKQKKYRENNCDLAKWPFVEFMHVFFSVFFSILKWMPNH